MDGFLLFFWLKRITRLFNDVDDVVGWLTYTYNFSFKKLTQLRHALLIWNWKNC